MNNKKNKIIVLFLIFLIGITGVMAYYNGNYVIPNKFKVATYKIDIEEDFENKFGKKKVWIINKEKTNASVVLRINYNENWSKEIEGERVTLDNNVNGENVVEKTWTNSFLNDFILGDDGWYYYKKVLKPLEKVEILENIELKEELIKTSPYYNDYKKYNYELSFNYETIQATPDAVSEIWNKNITITNDFVNWN